MFARFVSPAGVTCRVAVWLDSHSNEAVIVTEFVTETQVVNIGKFAFVAFSATNTEAGTTTAGLVDKRLIAWPPLTADCAKAIVPVIARPPATLFVFNTSDSSAAGLQLWTVITT